MHATTMPKNMRRNRFIPGPRAGTGTPRHPRHPISQTHVSYRYEAKLRTPRNADRLRHRHRHAGSARSPAAIQFAPRATAGNRIASSRAVQHARPSMPWKATASSNGDSVKAIKPWSAEIWSEKSPQMNEFSTTRPSNGSKERGVRLHLGQTTPKQTRC